MNTIIKTILFWAGFAYVSFAQTTALPNALSPRIANYDISVLLDTEKKMLEGKERLHWKNPSGDTIRELQFHLYYNAYRNNQSTWLRNSFRSAPFVGPINVEEINYWGWTKINQVKVSGGEDLTAAIQFIQPEDGNPEDRSVISITLSEPVLPYESIDLDIDFTAKIPLIFARTGYSRDYFFMAQWFPKIGVYEPEGMRGAEEGRWNCHQFHRNGEFYADFGVYNVDITLPDHFVVGASGALQTIEEKDGMKTHYYRAEDVIDFAWTASPGFIEIRDKWKNVDIRVMHFPQHAALATRNLTAVRQSLEFFDERVGAYPYPTLTIVIPPLHGIGSSGMEYPNFITTTGLYGIPDWLRTPEILTVHEFTHQYFMQMVANNEQEEAWLDEGLTSYFESLIMDHYYGEKTSNFDYMGWHAGSFEFDRGRFWGGNPKIAEIARPAWTFIHGGYGIMSYTKPMLMLKTLEGLIGEESSQEIYRTYFQRWKFRHPGGQDFIDVVNEVVRKNHGERFGPDMNWFFDQVLYGTNTCDYSVASIDFIPPTQRDGVFGEDLEWIRAEKNEIPEEEMEIKESRVILHRNGELIIPVSILVQFEDGTEEVTWWNGKERSFELNFPGPARVNAVIIDPDRKNYLEENFINNSLVIEQPKTAIAKYGSIFMMWAQNIMQTVGFLI